MDRRSFLKFMGAAAVGAAAVAAGVSVSLPIVEATKPAVTTFLPGGIKGLPYIVENSGTYFGLMTHNNKPMPELLPPSLEGHAPPFTCHTLETMKRMARERYERQS